MHIKYDIFVVPGILSDVNVSSDNIIGEVFRDNWITFVSQTNVFALHF